MVSEDSTNSNPNMLHHFFISNSIQNQSHCGNHHHFNAYASNSGHYPNPLHSSILADRIARSIELGHAPQMSEESNMTSVHDTRLMDLLGTSTEATGPARMLSLSLSSVSCRQRQPMHQAYLDHGCFDSFNAPVSNQCCSASSYGTESFTASLGNSNYLKPAQSLLEEMVSVSGKDVDERNQRFVEELSNPAAKGIYVLSSKLRAELSNGELVNEQGTYLNLLKLLSLLEEVERRYEEYHRQLDGVVSSFEMVAGLGAGKSYTALALQAMSKHFTSLKKAIASQIRATKHKIEKEMPKISSRLSQLSLFDQETRHNRMSLQQLGLLQNSRQAFRPIRGLPENSVAILRAWLFEHFLHPYPNDSEKLMLASQTGLSKNQVSNWFINARVRLWKPMIEEMYKDEFGEFSTESDQ